MKMFIALVRDDLNNLIDEISLFIMYYYRSSGYDENWLQCYEILGRSGRNRLNKLVDMRNWRNCAMDSLRRDLMDIGRAH